VVTGDITQVDLPSDRVSGLIEAREILREIPGIHFVYFDERDVVRHRLVQDIIRAYDRHRPVRRGAGPATADKTRPGRRRAPTRKPMALDRDKGGRGDQPH